jgi:GNAT superfamily N-acetyltransferase
MRIVKASLVCLRLPVGPPQSCGGIWIVEGCDEVSPESLAEVTETPLAVIKRRLSQGAMPYIALDGKHIAGCVWRAENDAAFSSPILRRLRPAEDECLILGLWVSKLHRGNGVAQHLLRQAAFGAGKKLVWGGIEDWNKSSWSACRKAGFSAVLKVVAIHLPNWFAEPPESIIITRPVEYSDDNLVARARSLISENNGWKVESTATYRGLYPRSHVGVGREQRYVPIALDFWRPDSRWLRFKEALASQWRRFLFDKGAPFLSTALVYGVAVPIIVFDRIRQILKWRRG